MFPSKDRLGDRETWRHGDREIMADVPSIQLCLLSPSLLVSQSPRLLFRLPVCSSPVKLINKPRPIELLQNSNINEIVDGGHRRDVALFGDELDRESDSITIGIRFF